jgi:HSP20 family molecular chaperone IbpA
LSTKVVITQAESIQAELEQVRSEIGRRAFELSRTTGSWNDPQKNWQDAERELVFEPPVEVRLIEDRFEVVAAVAGVGALNVQVAPEAVLIKGDGPHAACSKDGVVKLCDFSRGRVVRWIHFGERIDQANATAEVSNGLLRVTAPLFRQPAIAVDEAPAVRKTAARKAAANVTETKSATKAPRRTRSKGN